jgi:AraC family cel operon transcriptional repressor
VWNGINVPLERGCLVFVRFVDGHFSRPELDESLEVINLALNPAWWDHFEQLFNPPIAFKAVGSGVPAGHRRVNEDVAARIEHGLRGLLEHGGKDPSALTRNVIEMVHELQRPEPIAAAGTGSAVKVPMWLTRMVRDLDNPQLLSRPLPFWQKRSGRSPEHLARTCKRIYGHSPTELLLRARVRYVKSKLRYEEDKIAFLALESGFENLGYFYRVFRRLEGCTPKTWLQRESQNPVVPR